jgi:beta-phosphoglucomutase
MDGVLVDSYQAHLKSWQALATEYGRTMTEVEFASSFGRTSREIVRALWSDQISDRKCRTMDRRKEALYRKMIEGKFPAMEGAVDLIDALVVDGVSLAVGSSGPPENVELVLDRLGRRSRFDVIVNGLDVTRGKPDPQVFLLAAERLRVPSAGCVVIEDAPGGVEAARAAGMKSVALLSTGRCQEDFVKSRPDLIVNSLTQLDPDRLSSLIS